MSLGLSDAGINVIAGIDNHPGVECTYARNHPNSQFLLEDVTRLSPSALQERLQLDRNDDELLLVGCSPCQYWSLINTDRSGSRKTAFLLDHFQKFVEHLNPGYVLIENVPGLSRRHESPLKNFKMKLAEMRYEYEDGILDCSDYGVPQRRLRYVLLASRIGRITTPTKSSEGKKVLRDAIGDSESFSPIPAGHVDSTGYFHSSARLSPLNIKRIRATPKNGGSRLFWKDDPELQVKAYTGKDHYFRDVYARLYWDRPSPTITTKFISYSNGRFGHPEQDRALSVREGAAIQSFPRSYDICVASIADAAKIIGNAVPPRFAMALGTAILEAANARSR